MYSLGFCSPRATMTQPSRLCPFFVSACLWKVAVIRSLALRLNRFSVNRRWIYALTSSLSLCVSASTATRGGHHSVLRAGSGAGRIRRHVLQQLLPLSALGPGPRSEQRRQLVATERATGSAAFCRYKGALRRRRKIVQPVGRKPQICPVGGELKER